MAIKFPFHFGTIELIPVNRLAELRVSNGQARYSENEVGKLVGLHLADVGLNDEELIQLLIGNGSELEVLHIARNGLTQLALKLPKLKFLDARENKKLTFVDLPNCLFLEKVVLNGCAISELVLPESLLHLTQLEVADNQLTELSINGEIPNLRFLDVSENQLTQLPTVLADCKDDFYLLAVGNKFDDITAGILLDKNFSDEERRHRLKNYLSQFKDVVGEIDTLKVIFLGNTQIGKTSLADLLTGDNKADEGSTHGVNLFEKELNETQVIDIDFGGQDYYHSVHFPLFNEQALYLLLWGNGRRILLELY
jgi:internalin A